MKNMQNKVPFSKKYKIIADIIDNMNWDMDKSQVKSFLHYTVSIETVFGNEDNMPLGISKIGGRPDLPPNMKWETYQGKSLTFFAQVNLKEFNPFDKNQLLPQSGMLYFFFYIDPETFEYPQDQQACQIFYSQQTEGLVRHEYPEDLSELSYFLPCKMKFREDYTMLSLHNPIFEKQALSENDTNLWSTLDMKICEVTGRDILSEHWLLGTPRSVENDVYQDWARYKEGSKPEEFVPLLQLGFADDDTNLSNYGGLGLAYWGITKQDLAERKFVEAVLVCQSI
ncbi:MAG: DUF1963 domain-containing protein [Bernardetiaceae bacterium]|nr:DUF1963 domain-containing protein [Bernardetiaceae bacterium]